MGRDRENLPTSQEALPALAKAIELGQLTSTFVHEIKNSLNSLSLAVQNIIEDLQTETGSKVKDGYVERLSLVLDEIQRCDDLSRRLKETARRSLHPEKSEHHINEIVLRSLQLIKTTLLRKAITIEANLDPNLDPPAGTHTGRPCLVDRDQILQVLMNLLLNATEASPLKGRILIETRAKSNHAEIRVTDHGSGVPHDIRRTLFRSFSTTKKEGMGLGLFISRILIEENHGGKIDLLSSKPGTGTTFVIEIPEVAQPISTTPLAPRISQAALPESPADAPTGLLLVEDEDITRRELARILSKRGFSVQQVANGPSAIAQARKKSIGVVLMDIVLGDKKMDGIEAARRIQKEHPLTSFFFVSAYAQDPIYHRRAYESGLRVGAWIEKPIRIQDLQDLLAKIEREQRKLKILTFLERAKARGFDPMSYLHALVDLDRSLERDIAGEILEELISSRDR